MSRTPLICGIYLEALTIAQGLLLQNPDIQKIFAFEAAFEKLFTVIRNENGVDGGIIVHDCLACVDSLLRLNNSNQTFFRETGLTGFLTSLLSYPSNLQLRDQAPQEFALQFWEPQKTTNAGLVLRALGMLVGTKGGNVGLQVHNIPPSAHTLLSRKLRHYHLFGVLWK